MSKDIALLLKVKEFQIDKQGNYNPQFVQQIESEYSNLNTIYNQGGFTAFNE